MKRSWLWGLALLLLLAGAVLYWAVYVHGARQGPLVLYGNVDIRDVNLGFRVSGRLAELMRDEGDPVHAGDLLGRLDAEPYLRELRLAEANVASLKARYDLLLAGYRKEDIGQARATVQQRQAVLTNTEQVLARRLALRPTGAASEENTIDALAARDEAAANLKAGQESLRLLENGYRPEEITEAKGNFERAEADLAEARLRVDDTTLYAPSDGIILTRANEPGAVLAVGATVFTLSLTQHAWIRAYVSERELGRVHPGDNVLIFTDTRRQQPYHGTVGYVSPTAEFTPKSVETTDLRTDLVYRLRVVVLDADPSLRQGMPVTVRFQDGGAR